MSVECQVTQSDTGHHSPHHDISQSSAPCEAVKLSVNMLCFLLQSLLDHWYASTVEEKRKYFCYIKHCASKGYYENNSIINYMPGIAGKSHSKSFGIWLWTWTWIVTKIFPHNFFCMHCAYKVYVTNRCLKWHVFKMSQFFATSSDCFLCEGECSNKADVGNFLWQLNFDEWKLVTSAAVQCLLIQKFLMSWLLEENTTTPCSLFQISFLQATCCS